MGFVHSSTIYKTDPTHAPNKPQPQILPSDDHFCFDCSYIITVEGWSNTSYTRESSPAIPNHLIDPNEHSTHPHPPRPTVTATVEELAVVPLAGGRPQTSFVDAAQTKYFSALLGSSAEDLRISLTVLSGAAELYVGDDVARPPQANDSSTYRYTTHGARGGRGGGSSGLTIPGPHRNRTRFAVGVVGLEDGTVFSISASFSQMPLLLQEGVPLQQTVSAGRNEFFVYRISSSEDITITVTALQGGASCVCARVHSSCWCCSGGREGAIGKHQTKPNTHKPT